MHFLLCKNPQNVLLNVFLSACFFLLPRYYLLIFRQLMSPLPGTRRMSQTYLGITSVNVHFPQQTKDFQFSLASIPILPLPN